MKFVARLFRASMPRTSRGRIALWSCLAATLFSFVQAGTPLNEFLANVRLIFRSEAASGDIVLVAIDNQSIAEVGPLPWPRARFAKLLDRLRDSGARRVFIHPPFAEKSDPENDAALEMALQRLGDRAILPVTFSIDRTTGRRTDSYPLPIFNKNVSIAHTNFQYDYFGTVRRLPYSIKFGSKSYPSVSSILSNVKSHKEDFVIDYSIDPSSIPTISSSEVINSISPIRSLFGKDVVIGYTYRPFSDGFLSPGYGAIPGVYRHILGAETLKSGRPVDLSWPFALLPAFAIIIICTLFNMRAVTLVVLPLGVAGALSIPLILDGYHISTDTVGPLFLLVIFGSAISWRHVRQMYQARGTTNEVSGLPNLTALYQRTSDIDRPLIAARIHNYAAIVATLTSGGEKILVEQVANRLMLGVPQSILYQGDEGIFTWFAESDAGVSMGGYLDALHTMFRSPIMAQGKQFDLVVTFGFDLERDRLVANRLASALVAADDAQRDGSKWKEHDPSRLEDSAWKLSLLSQLDAAIDAGDLWVAYQPKLDLKTNAITGAEALARWTHSEKGPINPVEFILAAEQSNRIEKLTHYVLEHAIRVASVFNKNGNAFNISVNLSARLIDDPNLVTTIRKLLTKHDLDAACLTLEVTETAALGDAARSLAMLRQLRDMGVLLSVDDYGTGMSTLDYLQRIPATEIKIDRSFVLGMTANHATKVMVNSTIQLAHSLGQKVVAEGVEDEETLDELRHMGCDLAQGYLIGRPMTFRALSKTLLGSREEDAA